MKQQLHELSFGTRFRFCLTNGKHHPDVFILKNMDNNVAVCVRIEDNGEYQINPKAHVMEIGA